MKKVTGLILCCIAAGGLNASPADDLLGRYAAEGAGAPSPQRGAEAWARQGVQGRSCVSCHTGNLKQPGSHKETGEAIKPLAPSVEPSRLTDAKFIEKWFTRNCKWTYGRLCTAQEKADFLEFIRRQ
jgi:hypothetical protein